MRKNIISAIFFSVSFLMAVPDMASATEVSPNNRDGVYASDGKPHGNGVARDVHIKDSADYSLSDIGSLAIPINQQAHSQTTGIESTCAWNHEGFRNVYLESVRTKISWMENNQSSSEELPKLKARYAYLSALAGKSGNENISNNYQNENDGTYEEGISQVSPISQNTHEFISGHDSSTYHEQNISIQQQIDYVPPLDNKCDWADKNNIFSDEFAVVFDNNYNTYDSSVKKTYKICRKAKCTHYYDYVTITVNFPCNVPNIFFCSKNLEIKQNDSFRGFGSQVSIERYGTPHIFINDAESDKGHKFIADNIFFNTTASIYIGNGNHTFKGNNIFQYANKLITIGRGNHNFDGDYLFSVNGDVIIGAGNHSFSGKYLFGHDYRYSEGSVMIEDGDSKFYGEKMFYGRTGDIIIGNGNHIFNGDRPFNGITNISIGNGTHEVNGDFAFLGASNIKIGNANDGNGHTFNGKSIFSNINEIEIGRGNHQFIGSQQFTGGARRIFIDSGNHYFEGHSIFHYTGPTYMDIIINHASNNGGHRFNTEGNSFYMCCGNIKIGNGNHIFEGNDNYPDFGIHRGCDCEENKSSKVEIGDGNIMFFGSMFNDVSEKQSLEVSIGKGNHYFDSNTFSFIPNFKIGAGIQTWDNDYNASLVRKLYNIKDASHICDGCTEIYKK